MADGEDVVRLRGGIRDSVRPIGALFAHLVITVAILAQGTNSGDALCAALFFNPIGSIPADPKFSPSNDQWS